MGRQGTALDATQPVRVVYRSLLDYEHDRRGVAGEVVLPDQAGSGGAVSTPERRGRLLVVYGYALLVTGVGVVLGGLTVRLTMGADASGWDAVFVLVAVAVGFAGVAGVLSEPIVSRWLAAAGPIKKALGCRRQKAHGTPNRHSTQ